MDDNASKTFRDSLKQILTDYPTPDNIGEGTEFETAHSDHPIYQLVVDQTGSAIGELIDTNKYTTKASVGRGSPTFIPYIAVMNKNETTSPQTGRYIVYLFDPIERCLYLTLNQGATEAKEIASKSDLTPTEILRARAERMSQSVGLQDFTAGQIEFSPRGEKGELYGAGTICYKEYSFEDFPTVESIRDDLDRILELYDQIITSPIPEVVDNGGETSSRGSDDLSDYWDLVQKKQECGEEFINSPTNEKLAAFLEEFWTLRAAPSVEWILSDDSNWITATASEVADKLNKAVEQNDISIATEISGFGVSVASEALRAIEPTEFPILNDPAYQGMEALGYSPTEPSSASPEDYTKFVSDVEEAIEHYDLVQLAEESTDIEISNWATDLQIADNLFYQHTNKDHSFSFEVIKTGDSESSQREQLETQLTQPKFSVILPTNLYFHEREESRLKQQINAALNSGKHIIFTGPPGTGKSKLAKHIAVQAENRHDEVDGHVFTTATAEWTTFDTIGGYVPDKSGDNLKFDPRLFLRCFRNDDGEIQNKWLVIDELNRANIDKALGPLFSVLAQDSVELPYEREGRIQIDWVDSTPDDEETLSEITQDPDRFPVTPSWWLIGTMNTVDKTSLYDLSFAFMRRFSFIHVGVPDLTIDIDDEETVVRGLLDPEIYGQNYATIWQHDTQELQATLEEYHEELSIVWAIVNKYRPIGPAIVLDLLHHLHAHEGGNERTPLTSAIISLVLPQMEGLREQDQLNLLDDLEDGLPIQSTDDDTVKTEVELRIDFNYLRRKAYDMFDLDPDK